MRLLWADECAGPAGVPPDPQLWRAKETDRWQSAEEVQIYTTDRANAHYDGSGHLVLTAIRQQAGLYSSARLSARHAVSPAAFRYGRFEARIRVPTGAGIWPAWWLLGPDHQLGWPHCGEVDIMEAPSSPDNCGQVHQGIHTAHAVHGHDVSVGVTPIAGAWGSAFHTYRVDWKPGRFHFFVDTQHTGTVTRQDVQASGGSWPFDDHPQSPILNLAVGGWAGAPGAWSEQSMLVSYVRVHGWD